MEVASRNGRDLALQHCVRLFSFCLTSFSLTDVTPNSRGYRRWSSLTAREKTRDGFARSFRFSAGSQAPVDERARCHGVTCFGCVLEMKTRRVFGNRVFGNSLRIILLCSRLGLLDLQGGPSIFSIIATMQEISFVQREWYRKTRNIFFFTIFDVIGVFFFLLRRVNKRVI